MPFLAFFSLAHTQIGRSETSVLTDEEPNPTQPLIRGHVRVRLQQGLALDWASHDGAARSVFKWFLFLKAPLRCLVLHGNSCLHTHTPLSTGGLFKWVKGLCDYYKTVLEFPLFSFFIKIILL